MSGLVVQQQRLMRYRVDKQTDRQTHRQMLLKMLPTRLTSQREQ